MPSTRAPSAGHRRSRAHQRALAAVPSRGPAGTLPITLGTFRTDDSSEYANDKERALLEALNIERFTKPERHRRTDNNLVKSKSYGTIHT